MAEVREQSRDQTTGSSAPGSSSDASEQLALLSARHQELQRERDHLIAIVDMLQEISSSLHFVDILQTISRKLGDTFQLDRCAIFLTDETEGLRLVASYEDSSIRNLVVDINRYPELRRTFETGETVFIADAIADPEFAAVRSQLEQRNVRSIIVVPLSWQDKIIGAIFLRTKRDGKQLSESDLGFCQGVAALTSKALHNAHRFEAVVRHQQDVTAAQRRAELRRIVLMTFLRRLLVRYAAGEDASWGDARLPRASDEEIERLVGVAMQVFDEEAKG